MFKYEEALRALGPKYQCITVPYWTWEREAATRKQSSILGDLFGTYMANVPTPEAGQCVRDGKFARNVRRIIIELFYQFPSLFRLTDNVV